jgi:hypothetical protein
VIEKASETPCAYERQRAARISSIKIRLTFIICSDSYHMQETYVRWGSFQKNLRFLEGFRVALFSSCLLQDFPSRFSSELDISIYYCEHLWALPFVQKVYWLPPKFFYSRLLVAGDTFSAVTQHLSILGFRSTPLHTSEWLNGEHIFCATYSSTF